ncbi:integrase [Novosphingobium sp. PhB165]|nr:integrase arm-type DNA-binding domain-containing protein [Novosphingobium sp. PhB165]TCM19039.1 integrase [Novosphingobium sp. PhB165]
MGKLSAAAVKSITRPGRWGDGDGLFLVVQPSGTKSWLCRVQKNGTRRDFGLGSATKVPLALARERAAEIRTWVEMGLDPILERQKAEGVPTFRLMAGQVIAALRKTWRNEKHEAQWMTTLEVYAFPRLGNVKVSEITGPMIREVLMAIWLSKPETARRVRQRIGTVLDWAYASGYRDSEAPMRAISKGLPRQPKKDNHFEAMDYDRVPAFLVKLSARESYGRFALHFAILTAARSGEVRGATWDEIDLEAKLWTIPKQRMKAQREHVVPLSTPAIRILERCAELRHPRCPLLFPGLRRNAPLSNMTLTQLLRDMKQTCTVHGFRSSFRDWVSEETQHPGDVAEAALAHLVKDKTEAAYRRGNLLQKRRIMMDDWAAFCCQNDSGRLDASASASESDLDHEE